MQRSTHVFPRYLNQNVVHIPTPCPSGHHDLVVPLPLSEQHIRVMWLPHTQLSAICRRFSVPWLAQTLASDGRAVNVESAMEKEAWTGSLSLSLSLARTHKRARSLSVSLSLSPSLSLSFIFNTYYFINYWLRLILYTQLTQNALLFPLQNGYSNKPRYYLISILSVLFTINKGIMI